MKLPTFINFEKQARVLLAGFGPLPLSLMKNLIAFPGEATVVGLMPVSNLQRYRYLKEHPAETELLQLANENQVRILTAQSINSHEFKTELLSLSPHVLLVAGWSEILKAPILSTANVAMINCHGSLLPQYRGACPYIATIFNGDKKTGFTFHLLDKGIDTGDILVQQEVAVEPGETATELERRMARQFGESVIDLLRGLKLGAIVPRKQTGDVSYVSRKCSEWAWIPWEENAEVIDRRMRALVGTLHLATSLDGLVLGFEKGKVVNSIYTDSNEHTNNLFRFRDRLCTGTVLATEADKIVVSTQNPDYVVELSMPAIVPTGQQLPLIYPGSQFYSIMTKTILKSA